MAWKRDNVTQFPVQAWYPGLAKGWAGLWSLTGGGFPASLVSLEWSVHMGAVTLGAIVSQ